MALLPDDLSEGPLDLRRWTIDMAEEMCAAVTLSLPELRRWMPWAQGVPNLETTKEVARAGSALFEANAEWNYSLLERATEEIVGAAGLHVVNDPDTPEIGYWVRSDRTGRGYATSAARALARAAFTYLPHVSQVKIRMDQDNAASAAVPPKAGFRLLREEDREIETAGHTGKGFVWILDRAS